MYKPLFNRLGRSGLRRAWPLLALWACTSLASAASVDISLQFRPSSDGSGFKNTTPPSGFCQEYGGCGEQIASVAVPVEYERRVLSGLPPIARRWSLRTPPQAKVTLLSANGSSIAADFDITHVAQVLGGQGVDRPENPASHSSTGGNCAYVSAYGSSGNRVGFIWRIADPVSPGLCYPASSGAQTPREIDVTARSMSVGYRLKLPKPHGVRSGLYYGSVTYSVGEAGDFSLGSQVSQLSDSSVTFNFTVDVQHQLSVDFPAGYENVDLQPPARYGGWHQYLTGLKPPPSRIEKFLPFRMSASGPFSIQLRCDEPVGSACGVRNVSNQRIAKISLFLTLPASITYRGTPVKDALMQHDWVFEVEPNYPVVDEPGLLEIASETMDFQRIMLKNPGHPFRGSFTLVFDAQI
ncbi:hypothetical protein [Pseudomonas sp. RIT-PI-S]|uniref:hypothetical protein n=1 Tax=Pseudomonas sp. RIT-PI-S TaxID=3035295 RepID=UPI0021D9C355|nr:hypothetical protein [Pseudomonas sp. RIT-PI-S]